MTEEWEKPPGIPISVSDEVYGLWYYVHRQFRTFHRITASGRSPMFDSDWVPCGNISPEIIVGDFDDALCQSRCGKPAAAWKDFSNANLPHTMMAILQMSQPDDRLLRMEALTIAAAMITRLENGMLLGHTVIPVTAITVFGGWKLRVLQAHYSYEGLVIRKSQMLDFSSKEAAIPNMERLLSLMASRKVGNTKDPKILVESEPLFTIPPREYPDTTRSFFRRSTSIFNLLDTLTRRESSSDTTVRQDSGQQQSTVRPRARGRAPIPDFTPYAGPEDPSPIDRFRENVPPEPQSRGPEEASLSPTPEAKMSRLSIQSNDPDNRPS